jgi:hypothetical protein
MRSLMLVPTASLKVILFCLCGDEEPDAGAHRCTASQHTVQQAQAATSKHQVDPAPEVRQVRLQQIIEFWIYSAFLSQRKSTSLLPPKYTKLSLRKSAQFLIQHASLSQIFREAPNHPLLFTFF